MKKLFILTTGLFVAAISAHAQSSQWVAYNDHIRGAGTHPNATSWNIFGTAQTQIGSNGFLTNIVTGAQLPVTMTCSNITNGIQGGAAAGAPSAGSPAGIMFSGFVDFGTAASNHAVQLGNSTTTPNAAKIVHTFSGLDPNRRYSWHGTAVRGNNYVDRWTLLEIGAAAWQNAHTMTATGVFTTVEIPSLTSAQAVANFGENRLLGVIAGWTNIQPNPDGTLHIYQSTYRGSMPAGFSTGTAYGYAVVADRLEEFTVGADSCVAITNESGNISVPERGTAVFSISATGTPQTVRWYRSNDGGANYSLIPGAVSSTYTFSPVAVSDNGAKFYANVSNSACNVSSTVKTLTVIADTVAPTALTATGDTNLTNIIISFSEPLSAGIDPSSFTIYPTGSNPDVTGVTASTAVVTNGTNVLVTAVPGSMLAGGNYSIQIIDVYDTAATPNVISPYPTFLPIRSTVLLFSYSKVWRYDQSGTDLGTAWKESVYDDSLWPSGPGVLGFETTANTLTFLNSISPPTGTNTVLSLTNNTGAGIGGTNITFYFRTTLNIPNFNPGLATLTMRAYIDDGAILYINGTERFRYNQTNGPGYLMLANAALTEPTPAPATTFVVSNLTGFVQGNNVIAVEVHQDARTSSDIDWGMQLEALVSSFAPLGPTLNPSVSGNTFTITWTGGGTLQRSTDLNSSANWATITGAASPFVTNTTAASKMFFRLVTP